MRFPSTNPSGCSAAAAHVLWEHEAVGSNPTTPTTILTGGSLVSLRCAGIALRLGRRAVRIVCGEILEGVPPVTRTATNERCGSLSGAPAIVEDELPD